MSIVAPSRPRSFATCCALVLCTMFLVPQPTSGQSQASTGQLVGVVTDPDGATIPGCQITATNSDTGLARTVHATESGLFSLVALPPGRYGVRAEASGFQPRTFDQVDVVVGRTVTLQVVLSAGGVSEQVTVTAGSVDVQTTRSEPEAVINDTAISNLPINGRRFQDFVTLTPTAQVEPARQQISLAGQRGINANINVDGVDYNNPYFGGIKGGERSNFAYTIPQESIREFQVVATGYSAEFGRSTGGLVNAVTKSGTNEFHGSALYFIRPKDFAAHNEFFDTINEGDPTKTDDNRDLTFVPTQQQWGGSIGGPIRKDRIFFFGAYEQQRIRLPRAVEFSSLQGVTSMPNTAEALSFFRSQEQSFEATNDALAALGRVDAQLDENNSLNVRYSYSRNNGENAVNTGAAVLPLTARALTNDGEEQDRTHTVVGQLVTIVSATVINELRGQFAREERPRLANSTIPNLATAFANTGNRNFLPNYEDDKRIQLADGLTATLGNHTLKVGGEYNYIRAFQRFGFNQFGQYNVPFNPDINVTLEQLSVGGPTPNVFDTGGYRYIQQIGNLEAQLNSTEFAFYVQDSWRILPNFTVNAGLRYEAQYNPQPDANNTDLVETVAGFRFPVGATIEPSIIPDARNQWAPRAGFAWDPWGNGKTVIRGNGGIYFARTPLLLFASPVNNFRLPPGDVSITLPFPVSSGQPATLYDQLLLIGIDLNQYSLGQLPQVSPDQIQQVAAALGLTPNPFLGVSVFGVDTHFQNPRSYQAGIGVEHEILTNFTIGADFTYVHTTRLERNRVANLPLPVIDPTDVSQRPQFLVSGAVRPIPTLRDVTVRESSAKALFRALTIRSKFQRNWGQFSVFYTLSSNYADDDNEREATAISADDTYNLTPEYGYSNLDRRHQFTSNSVFFLPWGFEVANTLRLMSGAPFDARVGYDANKDTINVDRPYAAPGVPFVRNAFRNEPLYFVDLRVQKSFAFSDNQSLAIIADFFNLFNIENATLNQSFSNVANYCASPVGPDCGFNGPTNLNFAQLRDQVPTSKTYGKLLTGNNAGSPFQVQIGVRYQF